MPLAAPPGPLWTADAKEPHPVEFRARPFGQRQPLLPVLPESPDVAIPFRAKSWFQAHQFSFRILDFLRLRNGRIQPGDDPCFKRPNGSNQAVSPRVRIGMTTLGRVPQPSFQNQLDDRASRRCIGVLRHPDVRIRRGVVADDVSVKLHEQHVHRRLAFEQRFEQVKGPDFGRITLAPCLDQCPAAVAESAGGGIDRRLERTNFESCGLIEGPYPG